MIYFTFVCAEVKVVFCVQHLPYKQVNPIRTSEYLQVRPLSICSSAEGGNVIVTGAGP